VHSALTNLIAVLNAFRQIEVQKLEWMTMEDERVCLICSSMDGKVYDTSRFHLAARLGRAGVLSYESHMIHTESELNSLQ